MSDAPRRSVLDRKPIHESAGEGLAQISFKVLALVDLEHFSAELR
jgi:hypothetical protein